MNVIPHVPQVFLSHFTRTPLFRKCSLAIFPYATAKEAWSTSLEHIATIEEAWPKSRILSATAEEAWSRPEEHIATMVGVFAFLLATAEEAWSTYQEHIAPGEEAWSGSLAASLPQVPFFSRWDFRKNKAKKSPSVQKVNDTLLGF